MLAELADPAHHQAPPALHSQPQAPGEWRLTRTHLDAAKSMALALP